MSTIIHIDSKEYSVEEFSKLKFIEPWKCTLVDFLRTWFDDSDSFISQTSGSTGKAKSIKILKSDARKSAQMTLEYLNISRGEQALLCIPIQFIGGKMMLVRALERELKLIIKEPTSDPLIELEEHIDFLAITPHQLNKILSSEESTNKLKRIRSVIVGGSRPSNASIEAVRDFPNSIWSTFGMTETISHFAMSKINSENPELYHVISDDFSINEDDDSRLVLNSPYKGGERLVMNDLIEILDEMSFKWKGRYDNVINSGGIKMSPEEIESKIRSLISEDFIVSSKEDKLLGEQVVLIIESAQNKEKYLSKDFKENLVRLLSKYEIPKSIQFCETFPRLGNDKIDRSSLNI